MLWVIVCDLCADCDGGPRSGPRELNTKSRRKGINKVNSLNLAGLEDHEVVVIGESHNSLAVARVLGESEVVAAHFQQCNI